MKTKLTLEVFLPTTSTARVNDFIIEFDKISKAHKGEAPFVSFSGPYNDDFTRNLTNGRQPEAGDRSTRPAAPAAGADDFEDESGAEPGPSPEDGKPAADEPKRRRGRPPGSRSKASGSPAEGSERGSEAGSSEGRAGGNGDGAASKGGERRSRASEAEDSGSGGGQRRAGDADRGDEQASPVDDEWDNESEGDDWGAPAEKEDLSDINEDMPEDWWAKTPGDQWPDTLMPKGKLTRETLSGLMSDHFRAAGGKQKTPTFGILREVCNVDGLGDVKEKDFDKLARALLKDTARYVHGVKKPLTAAAKA